MLFISLVLLQKELFTEAFTRLQTKKRAKFKRVILVSSKKRERFKATNSKVQNLIINILL